MPDSFDIASAEDQRRNIGRLIQRYSQGKGETKSELISKLKDMSQALRVVDIERLTEGFSIQGDFEGCVNGEWQNIASDGAGIVKYKNKTYTTETIGFVSAYRGLRIQLCYAQGKYFSTF